MYIYLKFSVTAITGLKQPGTNRYQKTFVTILQGQAKGWVTALEHNLKHLKEGSKQGRGGYTRICFHEYPHVTWVYTEPNPYLQICFSFEKGVSAGGLKTTWKTEKLSPVGSSWQNTAATLHI